MPENRISFDDAMALTDQVSAPASQVAPGRITFDEAMAMADSRQVLLPDQPTDPLGRPIGGFSAGGVGSETAVQPGRGGFVPAFKAELVEDDATKLRLIAKSMFPDDPKGIERLGFANGKPVFVNNAGQLQEVSGRFKGFLGGLAANAPEIAGSVAGSFATGNPVTGGAIGAMGGKAAKQIIAGTLLDEPQTTGGNVAGMAEEGGAAFVGGGVAKGLGGVINRSRVVDFTPANRAAAQATQQSVKAKTGIDIDIAQASGDRKLIALRNYAARYPGKSAEIIQAADDVAKGQLEGATQHVLSLVATSKPAEVLGADGINAAGLAIRAARDSVQKQVAPLYEAAYAAVPAVTNPRALSYLKLPYFKEAFDAGQRVAKLQGTALKEGQPPDLRAFDLMKQGLDDQIDKLIVAGNRKEAAALIERKNEFVAFLDNTSGQAYKAARAKYAELAKSMLDPLEQGVVGTLAKIKNPKAATAAAKIFTDPNVTADQIKLARNAVSAQDPEAWNGLARQYMSQTIGKALKTSQRGDVVNPAGKIRQALFGTEGMREKMRAALPPQALLAFEDLMTAAEKLASTPIAGSDTAFNLEIGKQLSGRGAVLFRWLTSPRASIVGAAEQRAANQGVQAIAEAITDPVKVRQLRQVVRMAPSSQQALLIAGILSGQGAENLGSAAVSPPADLLPPSMLRTPERVELSP